MRRRTVVGTVLGVASAGCLRLTEDGPEGDASDGTADGADLPREETGTPAEPTGAIEPANAWTQFQFDGANTGVNAADEVPSSEPGVVWERRNDSPRRSGLVATTELLVERHRDGLSAFEKTTGEVAWRTTETLADDYRLNCDPVVHGDAVVFAGRNDRTGRSDVVAVDASSGERRWGASVTDADEFFQGLTVVDDRLYLLGRNNDANVPRVTAVSLSARTVEWTHEVEAFDHVNRPVAATSELVAYGGHMEYERTGSDPEPGEGAGGVVALDAATGRERWRTPVGGTQMPVTVADGTVFAAPDKVRTSTSEHQQDGTYPLVALDADDGSVEWKFEARNTFYCSPAATAERVYFGLKGSVWAVRTSDGTPAWSQSVERHVERFSPLVVGGRVLVGDMDPRQGRSALSAYDAATGDLRWSHEVPEGRVSDVVAVDGAVFCKGRSYHDDEGQTIRGLR